MRALRCALALGLFVLVLRAGSAPGSGSACALAASVLPPDVMAYEQVRAGMKGSGRTVFKGERPESFEVEILGKLDKIGPGQDLILARLTSPILAGTGVLEGMSGSPVYIDGKMIGAVAYSWGFAREAIAGITPIEEMLRIPPPTPRESPWSSSGRHATARRLAEIRAPLDAAARFDAALAEWTRAYGPSLPLTRLGLPLAVSGLASSWLVKHLPGFDGPLRLQLGGAGVAPASSAPAGGAGEAPGGAPSGSLGPGDAVGARLVEGDVDLTAFGTVTRVDGDRVFAFGHPFLQLGRVEYPMARARIEALLPSLSSSFKIAAAAGDVGSFFEDRGAGIVGKLGAKPRMVPVRLEIQSAGGPPRSFAYQVAADPLLTPILLYLTLGGILQATEKSAGESSVELKEGSVLRFDGDRTAEISNLYSGPDAVTTASVMVGLIAEVLLENEFEAIRLEGVNLIVGYADERREARISGAWADRNQAQAGETVVVTVSLKPYREEEKLLTVPIEIPRELPPGRLTLHVGDARALTRIEQAGADQLVPANLDHLLDLVNSLRKNRSLAILGTREEPSVLIGSDPFPNLPPSKSSVILRRQARGNFPILRTRPILDETEETEFAIEGYRKVEIEVTR